MKYFFFFMFLFFALVRMVSADVVINEIAWMGTNASANDEWIELYNSGNDAVSLDGWSLQASDGTPSITLSGSIAGDGFFLLERSDDDTVPGIVADLIYAGGLGNSGEDLKLMNASGSTVDRVNFTDGWPAGDNTTKETMQRLGSSWITNAPTPNEATNGSENDSEDNENAEIVSDDTVSVSGKKRDPLYSAEIEIPDYAVVGEPVHLFAKVEKLDVVQFSGVYVWTMGDGTQYIHKSYVHKDFLRSHVYQHAGEYIITFHYYGSLFMSDEPLIVQRQKIQVAEEIVTVTFDSNDHSLIIKNTTSRDQDIGRWVVQSSSSQFTFPSHTEILRGGTLRVPQNVHGLNLEGVQHIAITTSAGVVVNSYLSPAVLASHYDVLKNTIPTGLVAGDTNALQVFPLEKGTVESLSGSQMSSPPQPSVSVMVMRIALSVLLLVGIIFGVVVWYAFRTTKTELL